MILQKKSGSSWNNITSLENTSSKNYSKSFILSYKGTYRVKLEYSVGISSDNVISTSIVH